MDSTRCPRCSKRMVAVATADGRTGLRCLQCDEIDPLTTDAAKWADSPLAPPTKAA
jgi:tRNA(Ile2) C34 agmatinyltransferase TiaS